ncbi:MAG: DUF4240 domain-containing protein [Leptospiraceae bacterium]|nr:DUF4240 domain-containing protein [Leptospiraceae bacterium]
MNSNQFVMNERIFWEIIELLDWNKKTIKDILQKAIEKLSQMSIQDIYEFQEMLSEKLFDLDTKKHAENIGSRCYSETTTFSPDIFLYSRASVIAEGKEFYNQVLSNPELMPKDMDFEYLLYLAPDAYKLKTGKDWNYTPVRYPYETFFNKEGWSIKTNPIETTIKKKVAV